MVDDLNQIYNWKLDANDVKKAINKNFYNEKNGTYYLSTYNKDTSVLANSLVCLIGLGNDKLNKNLLTKEKMIDVSLSMIYFYYEALLRSGKNEKIIINDIKNKFGATLAELLLANDFTTIEYFNDFNEPFIELAPISTFIKCFPKTF